MNPEDDREAQKHRAHARRERDVLKSAAKRHGASKTIDKRAQRERHELARHGVPPPRTPGSSGRTPGKRSNARVRSIVDREDGEIGEDVFDLSNAETRAGGSASTSGKTRETDPHKLNQRQRQIDYGKNTLGYARYLELVAKSDRKASDARTPDIHAPLSKRAFDGVVRKWRRFLHAYDPPLENDDEILPIPVDPLARPDGTLKPGEYVPKELAELAERRARVKAEAEAAIQAGRHVPVERLPPLRAADVAANLPTRADMSPGWDALTPTPHKAGGEFAASRFIPHRTDVDADMMDCDDGVIANVNDPTSAAKPRSIYDDWEGDDFAGVV